MYAEARSLEKSGAMLIQGARYHIIPTIGGKRGIEDKVGMVVEYCKGCGSKNGFDKFRGKLVAEVIEGE